MGILVQTLGIKDLCFMAFYSNKICTVFHKLLPFCNTFISLSKAYVKVVMYAKYVGKYLTFSAVDLCEIFFFLIGRLLSCLKAAVVFLSLFTMPCLGY